MRAEMERLGLYAPKLIEATEAAGQSLDDLVSEDRIEKIKKMREELDRLRGSAVFNAGDNFAKIANEAFNAAVRTPQGGLQETLGEIAALAEALKAGGIELNEITAKIDKISKMEMDEQARELLNSLIEISALDGAIENALTAEGATAEVDAVNAALKVMKDELLNIRDMPGVDKNVVDSLLKILDAAAETVALVADTKPAPRVGRDHSQAFRGGRHAQSQ
ncbi:hypothetical protein M3484_00750 [Pseudomonas sp. GX19020]|uniref:hypothetical protein n=1 Tax=Pseudomonas sp. GX19020 TaxID=2942277 RepID=UPI0020192F8A|nr:hypothetical protein [Pseudomonas sp. GX19020]MCL4065105.1 hypothetical protein [Pseudomonas sp. GX19020]